MQEEVRMSFSGIVGSDRHVAVSFTQGAKYAEGELPSGKIKTNRGFSEAEKKSLEEYMIKNRDYIYGEAKKINPMRAFLGK